MHLLLHLPVAVLAQKLGGISGEEQRALSRLALGSRDGDYRAPEVQVQPLQAQQLALPHSADIAKAAKAVCYAN